MQIIQLLRKKKDKPVLNFICHKIGILIGIFTPTESRAEMSKYAFWE